MEASQTDRLKTAICVCTCNRPQLLERLLQSMRAIELGAWDPSDLEVIVVDNNPTGQVQAICDKLRPDLPMALHFAREDGRGISLARNKAIDVALERGAGLIAFIDDDDVPEPDWLLRLLERQQQSGADLVFGCWRMPANLQVSDWLKGIRHYQGLRLYETNVYGLPEWAGTYNVLVGRSVLERLAAQGPIFSPEFGLIGSEDTDFFIRVREVGGAYAVANDSLINKHFEASRMTFTGVVRGGFRHGSSAMHLARHHVTEDQVRHRRNKALLRMCTSLLLLPLMVFSKQLLMHEIYKICGRVGALHGYMGYRYHYYE